MVKSIDLKGNYIEDHRIFENVKPEKHPGAFGFFDNSMKLKKMRSYFSAFPDFNGSSIVIKKDIPLSHETFFRKIPASPDTFLFFVSLISEMPIFLDDRKLTHYRHHYLNTTGNLASGMERDWGKNARLTREFLYSYSLLVEITRKNGLKKFHMAAKRRYYFTAIMAEVAGINGNRRALIKYILELLKVSFVYQVKLNFFLSFLALIYLVAPIFTVTIVRKALTGAL